ncbi:MAG: competence/damage-inducible protein A [Proteobacteria bacterium]|nr:competence/damage-inducible protein A [Pseudomonadota bacterium]
MTQPTAALLVVGNEILSGRTRDANVQFLAARLAALGIPLREVRIVADVEEAIIEALNALRARYTYVFTTGGIGPTHDDITVPCVARAFGVGVRRHPEAVRRLTRHYPPGQLNEARLKMTEAPEGATLIDNPVSAAPGFAIGNVFVLAGVPNIMQAMFEGIAPRLVGGRPVLSRTLTAGIGEGLLAGGVAEVQRRHAGVEIGSYPYFQMGRYGTSIVIRGTERAAIDAAAAEVAALMRSLGAEPRDMTGRSPEDEAEA